MNEQMILSLQDEWMEKVKADPRLRDKDVKFTEFLRNNLPSDVALEANTMADDIACLQESQGFINGFRCAVALLMGGVTV